jgi:hypothetical protein
MFPAPLPQNHIRTYRESPNVIVTSIILLALLKRLALLHGYGVKDQR